MPELGIGLTTEEASTAIKERLGFDLDERQGCWLWRTPAPSGYGPYLAFYTATYSTVPEGLEVVHICEGGAKGCVRPSHLDIVPIGSAVSRIRDKAIALHEKVEFSSRIRDERSARRASRPQFAAELGVSAHTLRDWEEGRSTPTPDTFDDIRKRMGWDGLERRFEVIVVVERIEKAKSAGEAVRQVIESLTPEGRPEKIEVIRANIKA